MGNIAVSREFLTDAAEQAVWNQEALSRRMKSREKEQEDAFYLLLDAVLMDTVMEIEKEKQLNKVIAKWEHEHAMMMKQRRRDFARAKELFAPCIQELRQWPPHLRRISPCIIEIEKTLQNKFNKWLNFIPLSEYNKFFRGNSINFTYLSNEILRIHENKPKWLWQRYKRLAKGQIYCPKRKKKFSNICDICFSLRSLFLFTSVFYNTHGLPYKLRKITDITTKCTCQVLNQI